MQDTSKGLDGPSRLTVPVPDFGAIVGASRSKAPVVLILAVISAVGAIGYLLAGAVR